jgi:hypothetical protein
MGETMGEVGGWAKYFDFCLGGGARGRGGYTISQNIQYFFSDISLITKKSSRLVSHFPYKDITKVISKGRDK